MNYREGAGDSAGTSGAARLLLTELPCPECARPRWFDPGDAEGGAGCETTWCSAAGMESPVWWLLDRAGIDHNPAGARRPRSGGLAVPWVSVVTEHGPLWRRVHSARLARAQREFLCQSCGLDAGVEAIAIVDARGRCLTSAPLHPECAVEALVGCPRVARGGIAVRFRRGGERRAGVCEPDLGECQTWRIDPPHDTFRA